MYILAIPNNMCVCNHKCLASRLKRFFYSILLFSILLFYFCNFLCKTSNIRGSLSKLFRNVMEKWAKVNKKRKTEKNETL